MGKKRKRSGTGVIPAKIKELGLATYRDYLYSAHWKEFRAQYLSKIDYECEFCSERPPLNLHHKTYERLGKERFDDVVLVCEGCHKAIHQYYDSNRSVTLMEATEYIKRVGRTSKIVGANPKQTSKRDQWFAGGQPRTRPPLVNAKPAAPKILDLTLVKRVTQQELEAAKTPKGGWKKKQLAKWGVPWPPPKGWLKALTSARL